MGFERVYDYVLGKADWLAFDLPVERRDPEPTVGELARRRMPTCGPNDPLEVARSLVEDNGDCIVVNSANVVLGVVGERQITAEGDRVEDIMRQGPTTYRPDHPAVEALTRMAKAGVDRLVVTRPDGTLIGVFIASDAHHLLHERPV